MSNGEAALSYCAREVHTHDHDRYLTALFVPADRREAVFALYAFNAEVARTREAVSEPILGQIRLQWWREALGGIYEGTVREHPVVEGLNDAIQGHGLERERFETLLDARTDDLDDAPPADLAALEAYAGATSGTLSAMVMAILGFTDGAPVRAAHMVGTAWALIGLMRAVGFHAQSQRLYLPDDLLHDHSVDRRALFELKPSPALNQVVRDVAQRAAELLAEARSLKGEVPRAARCGLLLAPLADRHLRDVVRADYDPFALPAGAPAQPLRLTWASLRKTY
ncbi:MAG: squalene/phytoene synthase family protein [Alphaproteobacteria bacterium]|nr:squalene/phytoene synthase family protein [Alphaproteobacteria bacterium]